MIPAYIRVHGQLYRLKAPAMRLKFRGALYRLALQLPQPSEDDQVLIDRMVRECAGPHMTYGPIAKRWCVYPPNGDTSRFIRRVHTEEQARKEAEALLFRQRYLGIPLTADAQMRTAVIKRCRQQDKDDRPASKQVWCLYTHDGSRLLGRHPTEEAAKRQERAIQVRKHGSAPECLSYRGATYRLVSTV